MFSHTFRGSTISGSDGVCIIGNVATVGGKRIIIPQGSSISIINSELFVNGKRYKGEPESTEPLLTVTRAFVLADDAHKYVIRGADKVIFKMRAGVVTGVSGVFTGYGLTDAGTTVNADTSDELRVDRDKVESSVITVFVSEDTCVRAFKLRNCRSVKMDGMRLMHTAFSVDGGALDMEDSRIKSMDFNGTSDRCMIAGGHAALDINSMSGSVFVESMLGAPFMNIKTMSGSVHVTDSKTTGDVNVRTMSGSVHLTGVGAEDISVKTMSGSLMGSGPVKPDFETTSGHNSFRKQKHTANN